MIQKKFVEVNVVSTRSHPRSSQGSTFPSVLPFLSWKSSRSGDFLFSQWPLRFSFLYFFLDSRRLLFPGRSVSFVSPAVGRLWAHACAHTRVHAECKVLALTPGHTPVRVNCTSGALSFAGRGSALVSMRAHAPARIPWTINRASELIDI